MSVIKQVGDSVDKIVSGGESGREGLSELYRYFSYHKSIKFRFIPSDNGIIAQSTNFRQGSIVTFGKNKQELDQNIRDAILTAFEIPSIYAAEAAITSSRESEYAPVG